MIRQRCAIYTRKSTEEGLEQDFNSLDAQREACAAYILSQKHEGWAELSDRYDDGGFSGGSMERPGLKQLLEDVRGGRIDVIVVYKVDRLTRSLADFAKMVDVFDGAGVSFVSVTQAFNTTSSMGRLTLNVLLSFAQFEREVTAERIRDKVAASKRKGMWMGGAVPMGYDAKDRALVVNPDEAAAIRTIFAEYLETGSVRQLTVRLKEQGVVSKQRTNRYGRVSGGKAFSRGALYNILSNPIYIGKIRHKEEIHEGLHVAIIDDMIWQSVQAQLADHGGKKIKTSRRPTKRLLNGVLFDSGGRAMCTTYASKSVKRGGTTQTKRYWYYTSKASRAEEKGNVERLPAKEIERLVVNSLKDRLNDETWLADQAGGTEARASKIADILKAADAWRQEIASCSNNPTSANLGGLINRIDAQEDRLCIQIDFHAGLDEVVSCQPAAYLISRTLGDVQGMVLATRSHERFLGEEEREAAFVEALGAQRPGLQVLAVQGGSGVDFKTSRLLANSICDIHDLRAIYSMGGGNRSILQTLEENRLRAEVFVAHDLDRENRELILDRHIDFVLHHDLQLDVRNLFNTFLAYHGLSSGPMEAPVSTVQVLTPENIPR